MNWTEQELKAYLSRRGVSADSTRKIAEKVSEKAFQAQVKEMAVLNGWRYYHVYDSRRSDEGFPDCVMVHAGKRRLIFAELKVEGKEPTSSQQDWLDDLTEVSKYGYSPIPEVYCWRPSDIEEIWSILKC
jgi:hypothetical protein